MSIIGKIDHYTKIKVREVVEIENHSTNMDKDDGWRLRKIWHPVIKCIKNKGNTIINSIQVLMNQMDP